MKNWLINYENWFFQKIDWLIKKLINCFEWKFSIGQTIAGAACMAWYGIHFPFPTHFFSIYSPLFSFHDFFLPRRLRYWYEDRRRSWASWRRQSCSFLWLFGRSSSCLFCLSRFFARDKWSSPKAPWVRPHLWWRARTFCHYCQQYFRQSSRNWVSVRCPRPSGREMNSLIIALLLRSFHFYFVFLLYYVIVPFTTTRTTAGHSPTRILRIWYWNWGFKIATGNECFSERYILSKRIHDYSKVESTFCKREEPFNFLFLFYTKKSADLKYNRSQSVLSFAFNRVHSTSNDEPALFSILPQLSLKQNFRWLLLGGTCS